MSVCVIFLHIDQNVSYVASKMVLATKPSKPNFILGTYMTEGKNQSSQVLHRDTVTHILPDTYSYSIYTLNIIK